MTPVYFTVTLVHRYTVLYRQKTKSSNVLLFKHADEFIIHVFINYAEKEIYKKYKCRRAGKGRRCCLRGRIVSFLCHASSFAPGWLEEEDEMHQDDMKNTVEWIRPFLKIVLKQKSQRGNGLNQFCPPNSSDIGQWMSPKGMWRLLIGGLNHLNKSVSKWASPRKMWRLLIGGLHGFQDSVAIVDWWI